MAKIYIKTRLEPIELNYERAAVVKFNWLDPSKSKTDKVDLGSFSFEYSQIKAIDLDYPQTKQVKQIDYETEWKKEQEKFFKLTPEEKSEHIEKFKIDFWFMSGFKKRPSLEVCEKAKKIQLEFYRKNPRTMNIPKRFFNDLIIEECGEIEVVNLSDKMRMPKVNTEIEVEPF